MIGRREFITLLGGAAAWSLPVRAQQSAMPVVGFLHPANEIGCKLRQSIELTVSPAKLERNVLAFDVSALLEARMAQDPVKLGLVASLARPGGNLTGVNFLLTTKNASGRSCSRLAIAASISRLVTGRRVQLTWRNPRRFSAKPSSDVITACWQAIRIVSYVEVGGLMSYGSNTTDAYRQSGVYVGRILKGAKPTDLPVVQSSKFELVINAQTARMLGLERCASPSAMAPTVPAIMSEMAEVGPIAN
jgi:hypothetical protein